MLLREGIIDEIPASLCSNSANGKNVMLVVGDGMVSDIDPLFTFFHYASHFVCDYLVTSYKVVNTKKYLLFCCQGWEMVRAGAVAKAIIDELESMGCDTKFGCTSMAEYAKAAFSGRSLDDYYTEGKGSGLSFQELDGYGLVTTSTVVLQSPNDGAHYAPAKSLLAGKVSDHDNGMAALAEDDCTESAIDFSPLDYEKEGGNMVLWDDEVGGKYPWDERYYSENGQGDRDFDKEFIMRHATDSASTAGALATGHKAAVNMMSVNLYEEDLSTIVEDAMKCGKAAGVISSVPVLHATPGSFVVHSNYRKNGPQMQRSLEDVNPTYIAGGCAGRYQPSEEHKDKMREDGTLGRSWTIIEQSPDVLAAVSIVCTLLCFVYVSILIQSSVTLTLHSQYIISGLLLCA